MKLIQNMIILGAFLLLVSCQKEFLEKKSDKALLVPTTLEDFEFLLNNQLIMNIAPALGNISADDYFTTSEAILTLNDYEINTYLWKKDVFEGQPSPDWTTPYQQIFYANVVLDGLSKYAYKIIDQLKANTLKGRALFFRAIALYHLAQEFAEPYDVKTASSVLGLPVRTSSDVNIVSTRGTLKQTYDQILADLKLAETLLPLSVSYKTMPCKPAALAMLARTYLTMGDYVNARKYADDCLKIEGKLIDYNLLNPADFRPIPSSIPNGNDEVLFHTSLIAYRFNNTKRSFIAEDVYNLYDVSDLRKSIFFTKAANGTITFKGGYSNVDSFCGLATDEVFLIRAECAARRNDLNSALEDLNTLLENRIDKDVFIPFLTNDVELVLDKILSERRKELIGRNIRWSDLRRLNKEAKYAITLERTINNMVHSLPPKDAKYTFPIPDDEIKMSGIPQNIRE